jgi:(p)ppGpp synthase/HD superfamily hydrolase
MTQLGGRFEQALLYATHVHGGHMRKGTTIPYLAHLLAVAALVLEDDGDEDDAIAVLLHDAAEDQGGKERLDDISIRFGENVAGIVAACSDTFETPKPPWRARKEAYLEHLESATGDVLRVSLADKLHNIRAITFDYERLGDELWERFNPDSDQLWYYGALAKLFARRRPSLHAKELSRYVAELQRAMA